MLNRILLVSPYSEKKVGGIGTWTKNILDYHKGNSKYDLIFLNTAFRFKSTIVKNKFQRLVYGVIDSLLVIILLLYKIIRYHPKTIHYTSSASLALVKDLCAIYIAKLFGIKFIIHWRFGRIPELSERKNSEWKILLRVIKYAHTSIVLDQNSLQCLKNHNINNVIQIPNPISESLYKKANEFDYTLKIITNGVFVFIGQILPAKGIFELVEAVSRTEGIKQLILIGPVLQEVKNELIKIASCRNNGNWLTWIGEVQREKVFPYLNTANALCLPSYTEGFPNVVLEAMAVGCPVIASRVGAIEEMLTSEDFGRAGITIEPKNVNQLCHALEFMIYKPELAKEFGKNGNQIVLSRYTLKQVFHQYESIW